MEDFKIPSLPNSSIGEKNEAGLKKDQENSENKIESVDPIKSEIPYKIPQWSDTPNDKISYSFEILKSGQIIDEVKQLQKKAYWSFGRLPENDIEMAHPTISRFHAILQYRPMCKKANNLNNVETKDEENSGTDFESNGPAEGWYIYDLGSTHGTFLNKQRIPPKVYVRIRVGHLLKLGASSRSFILQGPSEDEEPESKLSITELKAKRQQKLEDAALENNRLADKSVESNEGCSWGMAEDADEETDLRHNPYASTNNEELYLDDPKKTLRGYFEREGLELMYKCDEMSVGSFVCRVELPIDDTNGRPIVAEVVHKGKKKDCVLQCALEACRILDRYGVLRQANQEPLKRKQKSQESDSDDDEFWDRTGDVARKKQRKAAANTAVTLTYEDLLKQENEIDEQLKQIECKINDYQEHQQRVKTTQLDEGEDLDAFMENLQEKEIKFDKTEIRKLRIEEQRLKTEKQKVKRLIKIAKPTDIPFGMQTSNNEALQAQGEITTKKQLPMIGKRNQFSKFKIIKVQETKERIPAKFLESDEEEVEENEKPSDKEYKEKSIGNEDIKGSFLNKSSENSEETTEKSEKQTNDDKCEDQDESFEKLGSENKNCKDSANSSKKRRQRIRQRGKREEVDINDDVEYESLEKYAKWIPPENQTGDGFTELNKKFGY